MIWNWIFIDNNQIYCQGIVKSDNTYNVSSDIQTKIKSILVKNNDYVTTNQIIIELDNLDFKYQLKLEKNKLDYHNKLLEYQKNKLTLAKIELLQELQLERQTDLHTGDITQEDYDKFQDRINDLLAHLHLAT